jgi:predicted nucleic acid-binding protein
MGTLTAIADTSVLIGAFDVVDGAKSGTWAVSIVTVGELYAGVRMTQVAAEQSSRLKRLVAVLSLVTVLDIDRRVATAYGDIRASSKRAASNDVWIAATALANALELVTLDQGQAALPLVRTQLL